MPRDTASTALVALRTAMGKTQQQFAVEVLKTAITTVARYETSHPPRGEVLLRLATIANEAAHGRPLKVAEPLLELAGVFHGLYFEEVLRNFGAKTDFLVSIPKTATRPAVGYLVSRIEDPEKMRAAVRYLRGLSK